jgi:hypothetical protein
LAVDAAGGIRDGLQARQCNFATANFTGPVPAFVNRLNRPGETVELTTLQRRQLGMHFLFVIKIRHIGHITMANIILRPAGIGRQLSSQGIPLKDQTLTQPQQGVFPRHHQTLSSATGSNSETIHGQG